MQGQRSIIGSLPETLDLEHGSTSGNASIDQPMYWNNMRNPAENRQADYMLPSGHMNSMYVSSVDQQQQNLSGWSFGGPSSSGVEHETTGEEGRKDLGWSSSAISCGGAGSRLEERRYLSANVVPLHTVNVNPQFSQSSNGNAVPQNLNLNAFPGQSSGNCQFMEGSNMYKPNGTENERIPPTGGSDTPLFPSGSAGYLVEENSDRTGCSLDRRPCKRKAVEGDIGQSSVSGSSSFFQRAESSPWAGVPAHYNVSSSLSISAPQVNPRLALGVRGLASNGSSDSEVVGRLSSHRNFRLRINPSNQEFVPPALFSTGSAGRRSGIPSTHQSSRHFPVDHSLNLRPSPSPAVDGSAPQNQPLLVALPALPQNTQPFRWNESSSSGPGDSMSSTALGGAEEANSRSVVGNVRDPSVIVPATELRTFVRNPVNSNGTTGNTNVPGNVASTSQAVSNPSLHPLLAPNWIPHHNPSRNSRRLAEYVRRSLLSSVGRGLEGQSSTHSPLHPVPLASSEETATSSRTNSQGHHRSHARSGLWLERQGDGVLGIPYPVRTLTAAREGRSRLVVSEQIRNVLDLVRRGESLRFEDFMILDQSMSFGMADIHDRHRDMRLDVDNMSYEELLALEERIGNVSTGLSEESILKRLNQRKYSIAAENEVEAEPCCICQEEYNDGEDLGKLDCGHNFHTDCIKKWLMLKNWCPICKMTGLAT